MTDEEFKEQEEKIGLNTFIEKSTLKDAYLTAFAKQKLALGTVMTIPGPKMFFQGDEEADLSHFKFFREFSNEKEIREKSDDFKNSIIAQKGYDTLESDARPDSIVGRVNYDGLLKNAKSQMRNFNKALSDLLKSNPALREGNIVGTFNDYSSDVHIHHLKKDNNEILVIKNFGQGFYDKNYSYYGFPKDGVWEEVLSSDSKEFGGDYDSNKSRNDITYDNQNISMSANSIVILRKI